MSEKIAIAGDHRGIELKKRIVDFLKEKKYEVIDCGPFSEEACDYPDFIFPAAIKVAKGEVNRAIGICYTGNGSAIAANKVKGVRAALCTNEEQARLSREHNDSNMLILGSGFIKENELLPLIEVWLSSSFEGGRHERRINKIKEYEEKNA